MNSAQMATNRRISRPRIKDVAAINIGPVVQTPASATLRVKDLSAKSRLEIIMGAPVTFVTGKGGVGKTTLASLLSQEAFLHGERVLFISLFRDAVTDRLLGISDIDATHDVFKSRTIGCDISVITPTSALMNYLAAKHMGSIITRLKKTGLLEMVANIVPGMRELLVIGDIRSKAMSGKWDRIIVDSPSTGHARSLFNTSESTQALSKTGVVKHQSELAKKFLRDEETSQVVVVTLDHAMPLAECREFIFELEEDLHMKVAGIIVNKSEVVNTRYSEGIDKNFENIFLPIFAYPYQNRPIKKHGFFARWRTHKKLPAILNQTYVLEKENNICVVLGTGGVGKTTTAAAIALAGARKGKTVALLTIDPARRLGTALGLIDTASSESHLNPHTMKAARKAQAKLHVFQLDTRSEFLNLLESTLSESDFKDASNNTFVSAVSKMGIINEFMAIEAMHRLVTSAQYDFVIVDTPPSHHVFDLLEAPNAIARLTSSNVYKTLVSAGTMASITTSMAMGTIFRPLKGLLGAELVADAVEFIRTLKNVEEVFTDHSKQVVSHLCAPSTSYIGVCNSTESSREQTLTLISGMYERDFRNSTVIINGVDFEGNDDVDEIEAYATRLLRFDASVTVVDEYELDDPFKIVESISENVNF